MGLSDLSGCNSPPPEHGPLETQAFGAKKRMPTYAFAEPAPGAGAGQTDAHGFVPTAEHLAAPMASFVLHSFPAKMDECHIQWAARSRKRM
jgi:hypothetical protein